MKLGIVALALNTLVQSTFAHYTFQYIWTPNDNGQYVGIRHPPSNNPVTDVTSTDIRCNVNGLSGSGISILNVAAGTKITMEWHQHDQRTGEDAISGGHQGPIIVYAAKVPSGKTAATWDGSGSVWFKLYQSGLVNASSHQWASDVVNANGGKHSLVIPKCIPTGQYLLRVESIALHAASTYPGAQFFLGCAQLNISSGGTGTPSPLVAFPGAYKGSDPGVTVSERLKVHQISGQVFFLILQVNIYNNLQSYTVPGPAV
ncbi:hypothetical protein FRB90_006212 [Tulasnella sp. 427]|nr:hypothetical protein FRB90_006212 [Tulasnella sp. 427]